MRRALLAIACCLLLVGCGSAAKHASSQKHTSSTTTSSATTATSDAAAQLEDAVRQAIEMNAKLSSYVLWHNMVPSWAARSTGGPALKALRSSATERREQALKVRTASQHVAIADIELNPSYVSATAKIRASGSVVHYRHGRRARHALHLNETAKIELHRSGSSLRFIVWKVEGR